MSKPNIFRRIGMRVLLWILGKEEQSRTCELNRVLYERSADGRSLAGFSHPQVDIGERSYGLRRECFIAYHPDDHVMIGKYCSIGDGVRFVFGEHRTNKVTTFPLRAMCFHDDPHADALTKGDIVVGHDVWLGAGAIVLSGVKIGNGAIVAAGAVVAKDVPPYSIVGGVPANVIRMRLSESQIAALEKIQWWNWPLEKVKANLECFYGDVDEFIRHHLPHKIDGTSF
jgi:acetyltransferase-like isoleucine patch superfamily enzyme